MQSFYNLTIRVLFYTFLSYSVIFSENKIFHDTQINSNPRIFLNYLVTHFKITESSRPLAINLSHALEFFFY